MDKKNLKTVGFFFKPVKQLNPSEEARRRLTYHCRSYIYVKLREPKKYYPVVNKCSGAIIKHQSLAEVK